MLGDSISYAKKIKNKKYAKVDLVVAPSLPYLEKVHKILASSHIKIAAQNISAWKAGSYTGEVSADMIKESGANFVIVGHSERRQNLGETDELVRAKIKSALEKNLMPILCIGETWSEKKSGQREAVIVLQLKKALAGIDNLCRKKIIIAYEPVWAIGSKKFVDLKDLQDVYRVAKRAVSMICSAEYFDKMISFIYGGSVDLANIEELLKFEPLNGFLIGSASLQPDNFLALANLVDSFKA